MDGLKRAWSAAENSPIGRSIIFPVHQCKTALVGRFVPKGETAELQRLDHRSLLALGALLDFEAHLLVLLKRLETL